MGKIKVEVQKSKEGKYGWPEYETLSIDFDGENIVVPEGVGNICKIKERGKKVLSAIKGIILPETVELSTEDRGFWVQHDALRNCSHLYENGFLVLNNVLLDYIGDDDEIIIPEGVEIINNDCFDSRIRFEKGPIKRIYIPGSVRIIGSGAFDSSSYWKSSETGKYLAGFGFASSSYSKNIESNPGVDKDGRKLLIDKLEFQNSSNLEYIEASAIRECRELVGFDDLSNLRFIGAHNFWYCEPDFFDSTEDFVTLGPILINYERDWDKTYPSTLSLPEGIKYIAGNAFSNLKTVKNFILPKSLVSIGKGSFRNEESLKNIDLPDGLKYVGDGAFANCAILNDVVIPESVEMLGKDAFLMEADRPFSISIPQKLFDRYGGESACRQRIGLTDENGMVIDGDTLIAVYKDLEIIEIPEGIRVVKTGAFNKLADGKNSSGVPVFTSKRKIIFPSTLEILEDLYLPDSFVLPEQYLQQKKKLNYNAVKRFLTSKESKDTRLETFVSLFLYQNVKSMDEICIPVMTGDMGTTIRCFIDFLSKSGSKKEFEHAAQFVENYIAMIPADEIKRFCELCETKGMDKAVSLLKPVVTNLGQGDAESNAEEKPVNLLEGKTFVTTGLSDTDESYVRRNVETRGGIFKPHFVVTCNYLVCYSHNGPGTTKYAKAQEQIAKGRDIKIITFDEFKEMISSGVIVTYPNSRAVPQYVFPSDEEAIIDNAVKLFKKYVKQLKDKMDGARATVIEVPNKAAGAGREITEAFYGRLFDLLSSEEGRYLNDGAYSAEELKRLWKSNFGTFEGQVGLCLTLGLFLAEYALCENDVSGDLVYARDKWEYRGDYSSSTRPALHIEPNMNEWKVYSKKGYPHYDM